MHVFFFASGQSALFPRIDSSLAPDSRVHAQDSSKKIKDYTYYTETVRTVRFLFRANLGKYAFHIWSLGIYS